MSEPNIEAMTTSVGSFLFAIAQGLHPGAACGAAFGCFFFLAFPDAEKRPVARKLSLLAFSWGVGYSLGTAAAGSVTWSGFAMFVAVSSSALAATIFGVINLMVRNDGPLPKWMATILDRVPFLKSRNSDEPK